MIFKGVALCCPACKGDLAAVDAQQTALLCVACQRRFPVLLDIPDLRVFPDPYIDLEADRAKGLRVAERLHDLNFAELVAYYYSITSVVPLHHAQQYTRGLLAAPARAETALAAWENGAHIQRAASDQSFLEIGCGTAPLLIAAARRFPHVVGVDIAFRWLVVAKKRLAEAGLDLPLICACAEALPFPDQTFDRVAADSVLETLQDQAQGLAECYRVLRPQGHLYAATPNRYSLGPDPHTGVWAGGYLPQRLLAAQVRRQGGIPPKRRLLSIRSLNRLLRETGFEHVRIRLPDVPAAQRDHFSPGVKFLIDGYHLAKQLPVSRQILHWIGPLLHASAQKPSMTPSGNLR